MSFLTSLLFCCPYWMEPIDLGVELDDLGGEIINKYETMVIKKGTEIVMPGDDKPTIPHLISIVNDQITKEIFY